MELLEAIRESGLITREQLDSINILAINNNTNRSKQSSTARYLVSIHNNPICSIKKIPQKSIYDIDLVMELQKKKVSDNTLKSPKFLFRYDTDQFVYLIEEFIEGSSLDQVFFKGEMNLDQLTTLLCSVLEDSLNLTSDGQEDKDNNEIDQIISLIRQLDWVEEAKQRLIGDIQENFLTLSSAPQLVSGDLWLKNMLLNNNHLYLVDYDLSHYTRLPWIEVVRLVHYAENNNIPLNLKSFSKFLPDFDHHFLKMMFLVYEISLQSKILDFNYYQTVRRNLQAELSQIYEEYYNYVPNLHEEIQTEESHFPISDKYAQLYWHSEVQQEFEEGKSILHDITLDETATYIFELGNGNEQISALRFDPCNFSAMVDILAFNIKNMNGETIFQMNPGDGIFAGTAHGFWINDSIKVLSLKDDPQLIINIPNIQEHVVVEIKMLVTQEATESIHSFKETERLLDVVTTQEDQLKLNDLQLYKLKEDVEIKENEVKQLIELNEASDIKLRAVELQTQQIREELLNTNDRLNQLLNSSSWKLTKPLRNLKLSIKQNIMKIKPLAKKVLGEKKVELIPLHQVVKCESGWVSTGDDPQFKLGKKIKKGWTEFSWVGGADHESVLDIYYDLGNGMGENQKLSLGLLPSGVAVRNIGRVKIPSGIHQLRLDPGCKQQTFSLEQVKVRHIFIAEMLVRPLYSFFKVHGIRISSMKLLITKLKRILNNGGIRGFLNKGESLTVRNNDQSYQDFINKEEMTTEEIEKIKIKMEQLSYKPMISIIVPVYNVDKIWLQRCIESVRQQIYPNWELCLVDDCSTKPYVAEVLKEYSTIDSRIKVKIRTENGHISRASNDGLQMAEGEFVALLDHDDELSKNALLENVLLLNEQPKADIIYSDEDKVSMDGVRYDPFFKPDWSPDTMLSQMYTCHLTIYRASLVNEVGGFRVGYEGSQDYDLMLRVSEKTDQIHHIPKILYHWRSIPESTASVNSSKSYTHLAGVKALQDAISRRGLHATVEGAEDIPNLFRIHYLPINNPKISIIIPSKNMADVLDKCLVSIFSKTTYQNFEVIIIDNGSDEDNTKQLYDRWSEIEPERFKVYSYDIPFNYSKLNNFGCTKATGQLLLLLNNDVEVITSNWLEELAGQASRSEVGAVGACLYYPDHSIQHAGVILGIGGVAGHSHKYFSSSEYGYFSRLKMVSNYSAVTAACLMVRKEVYEEVGGLEEDLQVAFNDVDFCLKIGKTGYRNIWLPQVQLFHYESKSRGHEDTPEKKQRFNSEIEWMRNRWSEVLDNDPCYNPNLTKEREDFSLGGRAWV